MLYKKIDPLAVRLEYACPFCLSAKFAESITLNDHVSNSCQAARAILTAADLADIPNLQISDDMTMADYYAEEEAYYKNMVRLATSNSLANLASATSDETLNVIINDLRAADHPDKNIGVAAWRIMATFFTLDDEAMERYLQIIYEQEGDEESEDEERKVWPAPLPPKTQTTETTERTETKTITILTDYAVPEPSSTPCTHDSDP